MSKKFISKEEAFPPNCPFCGLYLERPVELASHRMGEMPVGRCVCGAVFSYDVIGKNLGSAFIEALLFACNMDWDLAWSLFPEEDYLEELVEHYDGISHQIIPGGFWEGRKVTGALYFIRMHKDIQEVTSPGVEKDLIKATPFSPLPTDKPIEKSLRCNKADIKKAIENYQMDSIIKVAYQDKHILRILQKLLYSADPKIRGRAAEAMGKASNVVSNKEPKAVTSILQALFGAVSDTAASTWGAFEAIGEIIGQTPNFFAGYMPSLYQFLEEEAPRPFALLALGKIAKAKPDLGKKFLYRVLPYLEDKNSESRGYVVWILGNLKAKEALEQLEALLKDESSITIYQNGELEKKSIALLAKEAIKNIKANANINL